MQPPMRQTTVWLMATTVGVVVANIYYLQPLLADIARSFRLTVEDAGAIAMLTQAGTATGMFLFVPLGDKFERRSLIATLLLGAFVALVAFAVSPNVLCLSVAGFALGAFSACVHVVVPFAAHLAAPQQRGRVVGAMVGGILFGVLLARVFSGAIAAVSNWRVVYGVAAAAVLVLSIVVRTRLPASRPELVISWPELMRSVLHLVQRHALVRESALLGALFFAAFSAFWTTLVFYLQSPAYHYGSAVAGMFGLAGAAGAAGAPTFGHLADRHGPRFTIRIALWLTLVSFLLMGVVGKYLVGLIFTVITMDLGMQIAHVSNQTRIYSIDPNAHGRLNMIYMFCYFIGGGLGSYFGAVCWHRAGWWGVCSFAAGAMLLAILAEFLFSRSGKHSAP